MRTTPVGCGDRVQAHRGRARHSGGPGSGRLEQGTDALRSVPIHQPRDRVADKAAGDTLSGIPAPGVAPRIQQRLIDALIHAVTVRVRSFRKGCMGGLFDLPDGPAARGVAAMADLSVFERTFPARVAVLMRSQPITGAIVGANRQEWPAGTCDRRHAPAAPWQHGWPGRHRGPHTCRRCRGTRHGGRSDRCR